MIKLLHQDYSSQQTKIGIPSKLFTDDNSLFIYMQFVTCHNIYIFQHLFCHQNVVLRKYIQSKLNVIKFKKNKKPNKDRLND